MPRSSRTSGQIVRFGVGEWYGSLFKPLERAVEGLTAGLPVTLAEFERRIRTKMSEIQA